MMKKTRISEMAKKLELQLKNGGVMEVKRVHDTCLVNIVYALTTIA
jgi:hypothetical protein